MDFEEQVREAMHRSVRTVDPPVHDMVYGALARGQSPRRARTAWWATVGVAAAAAVTAAVSTVPWAGSSTTSPSAADQPCRSVVRTGVLPTWARAGFGGSNPVARHVMGDDGHIVAILFGRTLHAPASDQVTNKILWVSPKVGQALEITAVRAGSEHRVHREVAGGPGPSIIDLPSAGCWHLDLRWGAAPEQRDSMNLVYVAPRDR